MVENYNAILESEIGKDIYYCKDIGAEEPEWIHERAEITPIQYKSKQYGSDNNLKARFRKGSDISKGDVAMFNDRYYLMTWRTHGVVPDSEPTNMEMCNVMATIKRPSRGVVDPMTGSYVVAPGGYETIVPDFPAIFMVNGNYELRHKNSQAGLFQDNRTKLTAQANPLTDEVKRGDIFEYHDEVYIIRDINLTELDTDGKGLYIWHFGLTSDEEAMYD